MSLGTLEGPSYLQVTKDLPQLSMASYTHTTIGFTVFPQHLTEGFDSLLAGPPPTYKRSIGPAPQAGLEPVKP